MPDPELLCTGAATGLPSSGQDLQQFLQDGKYLFPILQQILPIKSSRSESAFGRIDLNSLFLLLLLAYSDLPFLFAPVLMFQIFYKNFDCIYLFIPVIVKLYQIGPFAVLVLFAHSFPAP